MKVLHLKFQLDLSIIGKVPQIRDNQTMKSILYHYLAWKYQRKLWRPFVNEVGHWLSRWEQKHLTLILVGPSAGYTLPHDFIYRYERVIVIEKDFLARYLFKRKFNQIEIKFIDADLADSLPRVLSGNPDADLVFCNVLGQVFIDWQKQGWTEKKFVQWKQQLIKLIEGRYWCSYHDLYSLKGKVKFIRDKQSFSESVTINDIIKEFATKFKMKNIEVVDHLTQDLFPKGKRSVSIWKVSPESNFFIEFIRSDEAFPHVYSGKSYLDRLLASEHQI